MAPKPLVCCLWAAAFLYALPAWAAGQVHFEGPQSLLQLEEEEKRVWSQSTELETALIKGGQLYGSAELDAYLQSIMDKLYPEFQGYIKVHAVRSPVLNAFAIANGNIYVNTGLLARFSNEAQLATVLAHEGAHFVYRHGYRQQQTIKGASAFAVATQLLGVPIIGLLGNAIAASSMFGFSRELETEADNVGFQHLLAAGYDVQEASKVFEHLAKEVELSDTKEPYFYSTHPRLKDRIANYVQLAKQHPEAGDRNDAGYAARVAALRLEDLESELSFGRYKHVIALLQSEEARARYTPVYNYYLGEAYRKRNEKDDLAQAELYYAEASKLAPEFLPTYRAQGLLALQKSEFAEARKLLMKYLELAPQAADRSYVENYLETIQNQIGDNK